MKWDGSTAIMKAARRGHTHAVKALIDEGVDLEVRDDVSLSKKKLTFIQFIIIVSMLLLFQVVWPNSIDDGSFRMSH